MLRGTLLTYMYLRIIPRSQLFDGKFGEPGERDYSGLSHHGLDYQGQIGLPALQTSAH